MTLYIQKVKGLAITRQTKGQEQEGDCGHISYSISRYVYLLSLSLHERDISVSALQNVE